MTGNGPFATLRAESPPIPSWLADMKFCHICMDGSGYTYCGGADDEGQPVSCPGLYDGEAICNGCGLVNCPRCVQLCALEDELKEAG